MIRSMLKIAVVGALVATVAFIGTNPAAGGQRDVADLDVTKIVDGTAPADASFVIEVSCTPALIPPPSTVPAGAPRGAPPSLPPFSLDLVYGAAGGTQTVIIGGPSDCTITETDNGGADSNTGPVQVQVHQPTHYDASITNTFDPDPTTTEAPTTTTTAAAQAAQAQPTFTG